MPLSLPAFVIPDQPGETRLHLPVVFTANILHRFHAEWFTVARFAYSVDELADGLQLESARTEKISGGVVGPGAPIRWRSGMVSTTEENAVLVELESWS
jgi:hypothetical protein